MSRFFTHSLTQVFPKSPKKQTIPGRKKTVPLPTGTTTKVNITQTKFPVLYQKKASFLYFSYLCKKGDLYNKTYRIPDCVLLKVSLVFLKNEGLVLNSVCC